ncbi:transposase [Enterococcus raffinosus]|uniref:transposase n=1 Tax=Enterococcus raffinosus TaxID=71452 RepID=UPI001C123578|nr:transposase [Enterococcus raffinosus]
MFWRGYKGHLAVTTKSQYILSSILVSAHIANMSAAIPLIRKIKLLSLVDVYMVFDKGHDTKDIYEEIHILGFQPIIPLNWMAKNDCERASDYTSTCIIEEGYT